MISNNSLNIFYFFDIEIIIFLFNYAAFIIYSIVDNSSNMIDFITYQFNATICTLEIKNYFLEFGGVQ